MEEWIGRLWHNALTRAAGGSYPEAVVTLVEMEKTVGIFFRGLGGDAGLKVAAAVEEAHGARRRWLQKMAGNQDKSAVSRRDGETLRLPGEIAVFPSKALNRDLYLWLAALAALTTTPDRRHEKNTESWFERNQQASRDVLHTLPGLAPRYQRLITALLENRIPPHQLPSVEAAQETALQEALRAVLKPDSPLVSLPPLPPGKKHKALQPVPLWLGDNHPDELRRAMDNASLPQEGGGATDQEKKQAYKAEQTDMPDNKNPVLMMFRAESLPTWAEYVKVNRATDDDPNPNAQDAAKDLTHLTLAQDGQTTATRIRFDLDLPAAAEDDVPLGPGIPLPEWDYRKMMLLPDHCRLQPMEALAAPALPLPEKLRATARRLRGQFSALAPQRRWQRAQADGPELDIDACVKDRAERSTGPSPEPALYMAQTHCERDMACLLLADLSLSTDAWISNEHRVIDVIRDSLLLLAEALSATGDRFGIYGFSSLRRNNIRFHLLKDFSKPWDNQARGRVLALKPGFYTRMGAALRQATVILGEQPAARRMMMLISDGKPNDLDLYDSRYGIEDTRMAVAEARKAGIIPFCVTIDREAGSYLPHLFGPAGFCVIRNPEDLPKRLPLLYAQLTR